MYKPGYDTFGLSDAEPADPAGTNRACHPANLHDAGKVRDLIRENLVGLDIILLEAKGKEHAPIPMGIKIRKRDIYVRTLYEDTEVQGWLRGLTR